MNDERVYVDAVSIKEMKYEGEGSAIAFSISVEDFMKQAKEIMNKKGYANYTIRKRKTPSPYGHTHYMTVYFSDKELEDRANNSTVKEAVEKTSDKKKTTKKRSVKDLDLD